jgi:beta-galactosidase
MRRFHSSIWARPTGRAVAFGMLMMLAQTGALPQAPGPAFSAGIARITSSFDTDWRFFKGDAPGAENASYDDSRWRCLNVPHDWSIEGPFDAKNTTGGAGGFLPSGIGWYRKHFTLPKDYARRRLFVEFDGIMANSDVWVNGVHLGRRPNGYVSFGYELNKNLVFGSDKSNVLSVRADNSGQPASRWYGGAGIYRHTRLVVTDPVHIVPWGTFVTTPKVEAAQAVVRVQSRVVNQSDTRRDISLKIMILTAQGRSVASANMQTIPLAPGQSTEIQQDLTVPNPRLWSLDRPDLYSAYLVVGSGKDVLDDEMVSFGIREARFEPSTGFWLNGTHVKIKGVCLHHDGGAFGAAVPLRVWEWRLEQLRTLGINAIRTAHNPPAPEFLDLCDRMGFLVMDEMFDCWTVAKNPYDYHLYFNEWSKVDVRDTVLRDRNHPSIILYSAGNEIHDTPNGELAKQILAGLVEVFHRSDPSRPVTQGLFRPNVSHDYDNGLADLLDVVGTNYRDLELLAAYQAKPTRKIVGTEQRHDLPTWLAARDNAPHAGQFLWSGVDYLGESPNWPVIAAGSGLLDRTGMIKPMAYERQSWWGDAPVVHVVRRIDPAQITGVDPGFEPLVRRPSQFADWNPLNAAPHEETVEAYSNCEEVELFLNGRTLGAKPRNGDDSPRVWKIPYESGALKAIGRNRGTIAAADELRTAGKASKIVLLVDRPKLAAHWDDVAFVTAIVTDPDGVAVPAASDLISFKITGPGVIAAVDSGDNSNTEPYQKAERRAYQGRCVAILKATVSRGKITIAASAPGLGGSAITIDAAPAASRK